METKNPTQLLESKKVQTINFDIEEEEYLKKMEATIEMRTAENAQLRRVQSENENTLVWTNVLLGCLKEEKGH